MLIFFWIKQLCDPSNLINPLPLIDPQKVSIMEDKYEIYPPLIDPSYPINCKLSIAAPKLNTGTLAI